MSHNQNDAIESRKQQFEIPRPSIIEAILLLHVFDEISKTRKLTARELALRKKYLPVLRRWRRPKLRHKRTSVKSGLQVRELKCEYKTLSGKGVRKAR